MIVLNMKLEENSYPITVGSELLDKADKYFNLDRKLFIITDSGVPVIYAEKIKKLCKTATLYTVEAGEGSKSLTTLKSVLTAMTDAELDRGDAVIAVGGGVVGDLAGFAASVYMRGIDFYNVPTTLLSQVDSSIGGKTAVNLNGIKNIVGSFKQPRAVLIDTDTLKTLEPRQIANGLAEVIKMAATSNAELFEFLEDHDEEYVYTNIEGIIVEALKIKQSVVEKDERETGLRRILNFGHTLGHGIEASEALGGLLHGECVALGMLPFAHGEARERIKRLLTKFSLPTEYHGNISSAASYAQHDKKCKGETVSVIVCSKIGACEIQVIDKASFEETILNCYN